MSTPTSTRTIFCFASRRPRRGKRPPPGYTFRSDHAPEEPEIETPTPDTDPQTTQAALTVTLPPWLAEWLTATAARKETTADAVVQETLARHLLRVNADAVPDGVAFGSFGSTGIKSAARMANALIATALDAGHDAIRISWHPEAIQVQMGDKAALPNLAGVEPMMTLPLHIGALLITRYNEMAGWSRQIPIRHLDRAYTVEFTNRYPEDISLAVTPDA